MRTPAARSAARAAACVAAGVGAAFLAGMMLDLPARDVRTLIGYSALGAMIAGAAGLIALLALRRRSVATQVSIAVGTASLSAAVGVVAAANKMFISGHDLDALIIVVLPASSVGVAIAVLVGDVVSSGTRALGRLARSIGAGGVQQPVRSDLPQEIEALAGEMHSMSGQLAAARDRERLLENSRRELVAWVSHDLRTPLAGIRAMAEALEDGIIDDPSTVERYHRQLRIEADRLTDMVDDLFELSRIHAGALALQLDRVPLGDLVSDAIATAEPLALAKGVGLRGGVQDAADVNASVSEISRVLRNLLHNAIRHTPAGGSIDVASGVDAAYGYVSVRDSCGGIPAGDLGRVFDVAFRGERARTPGDDGGAGLGLAIARGIVAAHHGEITVTNDGPGCRFDVRLPLA